MDGANGLPVVAVGVVRAVAVRTETEEPRAAAARVRNGRTVGAVRTGTEERSPVAVAGAGEKYAIRSVATSTANNIAINTIHCRPNPVTLVVKIIKLLPCRHSPITTPLHLCRVMLWCEDICAILRYNPAFTLQGRDTFVMSRDTFVISISSP